MVSLDYKLVRDIIVRFIRDRVEVAGARGVVMGLSGGVDSAVSCALAVEALGKERVWAYGLPYRTSNPESLRDAKALAEKLGVSFEVVDITPIVDAYFGKIRASRLRVGNFAARARMCVLFDKAVEKGALVQGTSNKSEILVGYTTWFGDSGVSFQPIGDLYKTWVWELAEFIGVPENIVRKTPSADLWPGQTDEGELGITYRELDEILFRLVDLRYTTEEVVAEGFDRRKVELVWNRIKASHFKRSAPVVCKISLRTPGIDFRYCRDMGR